MRRALAILLTICVVAADRFTKLWAIRLPEPGPFSFGDVLATTHHHNFGLLANVPLPLWLIFVIVGMVLALVCAALVASDRHGRTNEMLALAIILGGAIGNLLDRIQWGYVFDWILVFHTSILNLADIAIGLGLVLYIMVHVKKLPTLDGANKTP